MAWRTLGRVGGGLIGAAAGAFCIKQLQEKRAQAASIMLQNLLAAKEDPGSLTRQEVIHPAVCSAIHERASQTVLMTEPLQCTSPACRPKESAPAKEQPPILCDVATGGGSQQPLWY